jgi:cell wall assembly regulator SMI1
MVRRRGDPRTAEHGESTASLTAVFKHCRLQAIETWEMKMTTDQVEQLCTAAKDGDLKTVQKLLQEGVNPNVKEKIYTPLMLAARNGHEEVFFELIKAGADRHAEGKYGGSVLTQLPIKGTLRMIEAVIADGIRPSDDLPMALLDACKSGSIEIVKVLIKAGANVNHKHRMFGTPLLAAVEGNRPENVAELVKRGAGTEACLPRSDYGNKKHFKKTALEIAVIEGYTEIVKLLEAAGAKIPEKPPRPAKPGSVAESWKLIKKWLKENAPDWKALQKGAAPKKIEDAEQRLGRRLPEELRESYALHNGGGEIFPNLMDISFYLLPLSEVVQDWESQKQLLEGGDFDHSPAQSAKGICKEWWNIGWIPFASNGGGDLFCIDLVPASGGAVGQVISHNHETGEHQLLAASLRSWLHELAYDLRDGKYSFDEDEECLV